MIASLPVGLPTVGLLFGSNLVHHRPVVFVPLAVLALDSPPKLDFLWAGLCMVGAVYFIFRG